MMVYVFSQCLGSRPRQICEFKSSLVYIVSSRKDIQQDPVEIHFRAKEMAQQLKELVTKPVKPSQSTQEPFGKGEDLLLNAVHTLAIAHYSPPRHLPFPSTQKKMCT